MTFLRSFWQTLTGRRAEETDPAPPAAPAPPQTATTVGPLEIAPNDPLAAYFRQGSGVVEVERLNFDSPALRRLKAEGARLVVPLVNQGELIGLINLGPRRSEQDYSGDDHGLLNTLATQASPALRVAQLVRPQQLEAQERERMAQELRVARLIQQTLLPKELPDLPGWLVAAHYQPARAVGGDFYDFIHFWPSHAGMYLGLAGVKPGEVGLINTNAPGNVPVMSTGVMVIYADDESFSFMTPAGHPFNGMVTFSAGVAEDGVTTAQVQVLIRAYDPLYEIGMRLGPLHYGEDQMWHHTLRSLAARFGVNGAPQQRNVLVDPRVQWSEAGNVWHNAGIRTLLYVLATPLRWVIRLFLRG